MGSVSVFSPLLRFSETDGSVYEDRDHKLVQYTKTGGIVVIRVESPREPLAVCENHLMMRIG